MSAAAPVQRGSLRPGDSETFKQLKQSNELIAQISSKVLPTWVQFSYTTQADITARLRLAVQILYAEGVEGKIGVVYRAIFAARCLKQLKAIIANDFEGVKPDHNLYSAEQVAKVLEAMGKAVMNCREKEKGYWDMDASFKCERYLEGLSILTGQYWSMPTIRGCHITTGRRNVEKWLGAVDNFNPNTVLRLENETILLDEDAEKKGKFFPIEIKSAMPHWISRVAPDLTLEHRYLITEYLGGIDSFSCFLNFNPQGPTYYPICTGLLLFTDENCSSGLNALEKRLTDLVGKYYHFRSIAKGVDCMVAHVTLIHPEREALCVWRGGLWSLYPARRGEMGMISSTGLEVVDYAHLEGWHTINFHKATTLPLPPPAAPSKSVGSAVAK
jgi:hypothetical protein